MQILKGLNKLPIEIELKINEMAAETTLEKIEKDQPVNVRVTFTNKTKGAIDNIWGKIRCSYLIESDVKRKNISRATTKLSKKIFDLESKKNSLQTLKTEKGTDSEFAENWLVDKPFSVSGIIERNMNVFLLLI